MRYDPPLIAGKFLRRYKRFLTDIELASGERITAHCPNPGSMQTCLVPGASVWVSDSNNPRRKLRYTWEIVKIGRERVFVNPVRANDVVAEAIERGVVRELLPYDTLRREVKYGTRSRVDFVLERGPERCFVEVKNVTLDVGQCCSAFPDAVTDRGRRHLEELMHVVRQGQRAVLLFCASRTGARAVRPADEIDPVYSKTLRLAAQAGVEVLAYRLRISNNRVALDRRIPVTL